GSAGRRLARPECTRRRRGSLRGAVARDGARGVRVHWDSADRGLPNDSRDGSTPGARRGDPAAVPARGQARLLDRRAFWLERASWAVAGRVRRAGWQPLRRLRARTRAPDRGTAAAGGGVPRVSGAAGT